jgi:CHAT domain-containing protein
MRNKRLVAHSRILGAILDSVENLRRYPLRCKNFLSILWSLILYVSVSGQCPLRDSIWERINLLAKNPGPVDSQLAELLDYRTKLSACPGIRDSTDAFLLKRIGVMYYLKADYYSAVRYTLLALEIFQNLPNKTYVNPKQKIQCYRNLETYYDSLNLLSKRNEAIDSSISAGLNSGFIDSLMLVSISDKISYLFMFGDYQRCVQYAVLGLNLAEKYGYNKAGITREIFAWKIEALLFLNNYPFAERELKNKIQEYEKSAYDNYLGNLFELWARYYLGTGKTDSALYSYKRAFYFNKKSKLTSGCATSLNSLGFVYFEKLQNYSNALKFYFEALSYSDEKETISSLTNIGNVYVRKHLFDSAFYFYQKAFDRIHPGLSESDLLNIRNSELLDNMAEYIVALVLDKADARLSQYKATRNKNQLNLTLDSYKTADKILDKIKEDQFEMQSKLSWRNNARRLYEHAIEASWLAKNDEDALYFFEKSRAVLLDDQLKAENLMQNQEAADLFQLKSRINHLENELDTSNPHSDHYSAIQAEIIRNKEDQDRMLTSIRGKDPLYFARNSNVESMSIRDVQSSILKDHTALIEIFNGDSSVYTLTITNAGSSISKIDKKSFDTLSQNFVSFISNPDLLNTGFSGFTDISQKLYELIFHNQPLPAGRIIVSPDGLCFPFEALITSKPPDIHYMLNDYSISYTYSARFLLSHFTNTTDRPVNDFMGMAPVEYAPYMKLSSLPGSDISLDQIKTHFRNVFIQKNDEASKSNFLSNFSNYKIVQIYSHASYSSTEGKPVIYFADSSMDLSELFSKERPAARLVVLSACETALGRDYKGEGVFSFSREFAGLGVPAAISNLWSVDNESTYRITELFYEFLSKGLPTDEALQQAKLKFIKEGSKGKGLPYYWASPILTGKTEVIRTKSVFPLWKVGLLLAIAGILFWIGIKKNRSRLNISN